MTDETPSKLPPGVGEYFLGMGTILCVFWVFQVLQEGFRGWGGLGLGTSLLVIASGISLRRSEEFPYVWLSVGIAAILSTVALTLFVT